MASQTLPTFMINHGGGPCFFMDPPDWAPHLWDEMAAHLRAIDAQAGRRPKAVLVISAHWETDIPTVHAGASHHLYFDYYNFPEHTYRLTWPAQGSPEVAARVRALLQAAGIESAVETERGLDHGVFVPFLLIYPRADVPVVQLSLCADLSPERHLAIGRALAPLRNEDVLIVGSGATYHNLQAYFSPAAIAPAAAFDTWLQDAVAAPRPAREAALTGWTEAPGARVAHPREEHLLPLMVAAGAAEASPGTTIYAERLGGRIAQSAFRFG